MEENKDINEAVENEIKEIKKNLGDKISEVEVAKLIKDNLFIVTFNKENYRLAKPNTEHLEEMYLASAKQKTKLLLDDGILPADVLKKKWKEKGIDLFAVEKKIEKLEEEKQKLQYQLGKILEEDNKNDNPESFKNKIEEIEKEQKKLNSEILQYLDISLETRVNMFQYQYLSYLLAEKEVKEKWVKAFNSYEEYSKADPNLTSRLNIYALLLVKDEVAPV